MNHARPIAEVLKDPRVSRREKNLLAEIAEVKSFGEAFGLKGTKNYQDYVRLDRSAAVYVVSAAKPLFFESKEWQFPVVGRFPYLGWFNLSAGKKFAEDLRHEGWDVDIRGARAYSTLGWFRDAVLSSMIPEGEEARGELINVVLHESVHATVYISGQAYFNESVASFVADRLTPVYLKEHAGKESKELNAYLKSEADSHQAEKFLHDAFIQLEAVYRSEVPDSEKFKKKADILGTLQKKLQWKREINNATLIQFKTYNDGTQQFTAVFEACERSWPRFITAMKSLQESSFTQSQQSELSSVLYSLEQSCIQRRF